MNDETHCEGSLGEEDQRKDQDLSEALNQIEEACKVFKREAEKLRQEREVVDALSKKVENFHFPSTVKLNVGGHIFETSLQTLTKGAPNSMLAAMFSGKFDLKPAEDGAFFIDRDGTHFRFILNFLRTGTLTLPEDATVFEEVMKEANFYQIQELVDALERPFDPTQSPILGLKVAELFGESMIVITEEHRNALRGFLPSGCENWHLLFRASRHGFKAQNFHSRCDNKGPTVTIVQSGDYIFGGFMEISWASGPVTTFVNSTQSFLFSLVNPNGVGPTKMPLMSENQKSGMVGHSGYGPTFGIRGSLFFSISRDLFISNDANKNTDSHSELGTSYECPRGQESSFLTGGKYFSVSNYEVFGIQ